MNALVSKAIEALAKLPDDEQEAIARDLLDRIEADARWDELFADPRSQSVLSRLAAEAMDDVARGDALDFDPATKPHP